jgi:hypothetical protein
MQGEQPGPDRRRQRCPGQQRGPVQAAVTGRRRGKTRGVAVRRPPSFH